MILKKHELFFYAKGFFWYIFFLNYNAVQNSIKLSLVKLQRPIWEVKSSNNSRGIIITDDQEKHTSKA